MSERAQPKSNLVSSRNSPRQAFTRIDLIATVVVFSVMFLLLWQAQGATFSASWRVVCLSNVRQIMRAANFYAADHSDFMPHPTWGGNLTGPDGWAYATQNKGRIPGGPETPPSCANKNMNSAEYTNQVQFFKIGQLGPYLRDIQPMTCPQDRAEALGPKRRWFLGRPVKVTSYIMNAVIGGYVGPHVPNFSRDGLTFRLSRFRPNSIALWEGHDLDPFFFSDAGGDPQQMNEGITVRHGNTSLPTAVVPKRGGGHVGRFDGGAEFMSRSAFLDLGSRQVPAPNRLLCEPCF